MSKNVEKMSFNYSPNFNLRKRTKFKVKYLIFHYTGMKSEAKAIKRLTNFKSKVSCHYFIKKNGGIIQMVPDLYTAWHAGISSWKNDNLLNSKSIGIEISNPGHEYNYNTFNKKQIKSLIKISNTLIKNYKIKKENVLGHSDISPLRKIDPGEKFPWEFLSKKKICLWHKVSKKKCEKLRLVETKDKSDFYKLLNKFGYMSKKKIRKN